MLNSNWILLVGFMVGSWQGEGVRKDYRTGQIEKIKVETETKLFNEGMVSKNHFQITKQSGEKTSYDRLYWIRPSQVDDSILEMGSGEKFQGKVLSTGTWDGKILKVNQPLGGGYSVVTSTTFFNQTNGVKKSRYTEHFLLNDNILTEAETVFTEHEY